MQRHADAHEWQDSSDSRPSRDQAGRVRGGCREKKEPLERLAPERGHSAQPKKAAGGPEGRSDLDGLLYSWLPLPLLACGELHMLTTLLKGSV